MRGEARFCCGRSDFFLLLVLGSWFLVGEGRFLIPKTPVGVTKKTALGGVLFFRFWRWGCVVS